MRSLLVRLIETVKDQRKLTGKVQNQFIKTDQNQNDYNLEKYGFDSDMKAPFELQSFWRYLKLDTYENISEENFFERHMFRFEEELMI